MTPDELTVKWTEDGTRHELELKRLTADRWALVEWVGTGDEKHICGGRDVFDVTVLDGRTGRTHIGP